MPRRLVTLAVLLAAACAAPPAGGPPRADFLLVSGDSTYWVTAGPDGVRMRGSSIVLARYGGRFHEVYVADDDHSYDDALIIGQLVYSRDLITDDSTVVFTDTLVDRIAHGYAAAHPDDTPLDPDEPGRDRPSLVATSDVTLLDLHGPFLSLEYHADTRRRPEPGWHTTWRALVDLRVGHPVPVASLVGPAAGDRVLAQARRAYAATLDSARANERELPDVVRLILAEVAFDAGSYSLTDVRGRPAVSFAGRIAGRRDGNGALPLPPIPLDSEAWWAGVRPTLPTTVRGGTAEWTRPGYTLRATAGADDVMDVALVDSARRVWRVGQVQIPVHHVFWLDQPRVDTTTRRALLHAFDDAVLYDDNARVASVRLPAGRALFRAAANVRSSPLPVARRPARRRASSP
ncbi:MAG TPA: hypothetical protein VNE60_11930 [Gemmatimonadaceae bacterium]|nr:hypothetical protein [Gemmatimonadaceae bacterium]